VGKTRIKGDGRERLRRGGDTFFAMRRDVLQSREFAELSAIGVKLLVDLMAQFSGENNGALSPSWTLMKNRGWRSKETLARALRELEDQRWVLLTRPGGRNRAALYSFTFRAVDACGGKHDATPTNRPSDEWRRYAIPILGKTESSGTFAAPTMRATTGALPRSAGKSRKEGGEVAPMIGAVMTK
jgi:hypothetical protein